MKGEVQEYFAILLSVLGGVVAYKIYRYLAGADEEEDQERKRRRRRRHRR